MKRLEGKTAIVCGCAGGIGEAVIRRLAQEGAAVVLADLNQSVVDELAEKYAYLGVPLLPLSVDISDEQSIKAFYAAVNERFSSFDILHNNAADTRNTLMDRDLTVADLEVEVWDRNFLVNARGTMLMIKYALPTLIAAGGGSIINTSSGASLLGDIWYPAYAASKAAVNSLTKYVAAQYGKQRIRCNAVSPGLIVSEAARKNVGNKFDAFERHTLMPNLGDPEDIAAMVALLASDDGKFVTAQIIPVDGGIATHFPHLADTLPMFEQMAQANAARQKAEG